MEQLFWNKITRLWQWPWILIWPLGLHFFPLWTKIGLYYPHILDDPYAILLLVAILMSYSGGSIIKFFYYKPRPIPYIFHHWLDKINASSFPSIHTSNATIVALMRTWWWHQSIIAGADKFMVIPVIMIIVMVCVSIGLSRIELQKHYPSDVLFGIMFGMIIIGLLWLLYSYGWFLRWYI